MKLFTLLFILISTLSFSQSTIICTEKLVEPVVPRVIICPPALAEPSVSLIQNDSLFMKVQTKDTTCMTILRNTYGLTNEVVNTDGIVTFLFNVKNEARIVTNLATKLENIDYKIIK